MVLQNTLYQNGNPSNPITGSYSSIVSQTDLNSEDNFYEYIANRDNVSLTQKYFSALGRERYGMYRTENDMYKVGAETGVDVLKESIGIKSSMLGSSITEPDPEPEPEPEPDPEPVPDPEPEPEEPVIKNYVTGYAMRFDVANKNRAKRINATHHSDNNYFQLDGIDDYIDFEPINRRIQTIEVTFSADSIPENNQPHIMGNWDNGGGGIYIKSSNKRIYGGFYIDGKTDYTYLDSGVVAENNKKYTVQLTYDGSVMKLYINGELKNSKNIVGKIKYPENDTCWSLGANPTGNKGDHDAGGYGLTAFFNGKIYSARIYNRRLSQEEIEQNYEADKSRFGE